jgi:hypothetical protein
MLRFVADVGLDYVPYRCDGLARSSVRQSHCHTWPQQMVLWLRHLGGKPGLSSDLDGPYVLLMGIAAVFATASMLVFAAQHPFPRTVRVHG